MKTALVLIILAALAVPAVASATVWDMQSMFPNLVRSQTHQACSADGARCLSVTSFGGGLWARAITPSCGADVQSWSNVGMVYWGWWDGLCGPNPISYSVNPPIIAIPTTYDDDEVWSEEVTSTLNSAQFRDGRWRVISSEEVTLQIEIVVDTLPTGEWSLKLSGGAPGGNRENWWASCLPVEDEPGCDFGIRRFVLSGPYGETIQEIWLDHWVRKP